jgi:hypothetical protein
VYPEPGCCSWTQSLYHCSASLRQQF